jgi:hypothetical protein
MTKLEKMARDLNDDYPECFDQAFYDEFNVQVETSFSLMSMGLVTNRVDGHAFTKQQASWSKAYSDGYFAGVQKVRDACGNW